jgi:phosphoribosylformylglycinamidine synthase subunit PurQ / glutaminase
MERTQLMSRPVALIVCAPGSNRDGDVAFALELAGAEPQRTTLAALRENQSALRSSQMVIFPGGFSHADSLGAGTLAGLEINRFLGDHLGAFLEKGNPVLGICNGFQMLVRSGLLPGSLVRNESGSFTCRWVRLDAVSAPASSVRNSNSSDGFGGGSVWTQSITEPIDCPVAHAEGRYVAPDETVSARRVLRYINGTNPNGSVGDVAGVTDATGLILGLMPHPENHVVARQHPGWARGQQRGLALALFEGGVAHVKGRG